ncbi:hypothetical protein C6538_24305, partial [Escherichia coli]|nr:hypothetical protein [Escherichia coli]
MKDYLQTVTGPVAREDMGLTLPHEHLFNDLSSVVDAPCYPFSQQLVDKKVTAEIQWALKHDPYCCADNMDRKPIEDVIFEINNFISLGGRTIVDATGSESIGRDAQALREVALKTGLNIVASSGPYLEKFESQRIHKTVDELATTIDKELNLNRPGFPGECFICELRLPDHRFRWKHNKLFLLLPGEYGPA